MKTVKIRPTIKSYSWGSRDILPSLFHFKGDGRPCAEAWFGVHPQGESLLEDGQRLSQYIQEHPQELFGDNWRQWTVTFPLTLKVLAVNTPLSLHVHPDRVQAALGWADEEIRRRLGGTREELNYSDDRMKNELFYALTPSTLLCGFRDSQAVAYHLRRLCPQSYERHFSSSRTVRGIVKTLFRLPPDEVKAVVDEYIRGLDEAGEEDRKGGVYYSEAGVSRLTMELFGSEAAVLAPYLMNLVHMRIGEALSIPCGILHSYIHGSGVELEDSSDNEIRIGMSGRHKDIMGALNLIDFDSSFNGKLNLEEDRFLRRIANGGGLRLAVLSSGSYDIREKSPSFALCTQGRARVGTAGDHIELGEGECCFIPSCDDEYHIRVRGTVFQALFEAE